MASRRTRPPRFTGRTRWILVALAGVGVVLVVLSALDARGTLDGTRDVAALQPGDCGNVADELPTFRELRLVDCTEPHDLQVVGTLDASAVDDEHSATDLCRAELDDFADPELLALTRVDPPSATVARSVPGRHGSAERTWRCLLDLRDSTAEPRSLTR